MLTKKIEQFRKTFEQQLFVENKYNNCACITSWQYIQVSGFTYDEFKQMVHEMPATKYDVKILDFIEPVIVKYWDEDLQMYPRYQHAFHFNKEKGLIKWSKKGFIMDCDNEYSFLDLFVGFLLRFITRVDIMEISNMTSKPTLLNKMMKDKNKYPIQITERNEKRYNEYCEYMQKRNNMLIPLIAYNYIYALDEFHMQDNQHVYLVIKFAPNYFVEMNSNIKPEKTNKYNIIDIRDCEKQYVNTPSRKILLKINF